MSHCEKCKGEGIDAHLLAAATLIATEDELVAMGPWVLLPPKEQTSLAYGIYCHGNKPYHTYYWDTEEDARAVCAALNRNRRVREIGDRR